MKTCLKYLVEGHIDPLQFAYQQELVVFQGIPKSYGAGIEEHNPPQSCQNTFSDLY